MTLPRPGIYYFPWEVSAGQVPDGSTLRTFGRLSLYDMTRSQVTLRAQHESAQHEILICTKLVEPFQAQMGALYVVLGELEHQKDGGSVVEARVLTCAEGTDLPLLEKAIGEQRLYWQERDGSQYEMAAPEVKPAGDSGTPPGAGLACSRRRDETGALFIGDRPRNDSLERRH